MITHKNESFSNSLKKNGTSIIHKGPQIVLNIALYMNSVYPGQMQPMSSIKQKNLLKTCYKQQLVMDVTEISLENFLPVAFSI